ncbi:uncharacterized protein METZ01_LOCUS394145 [marine metagenome]|uniref:Uncharacterized protein n=1 Tax=marine metagenome TaxID=408172 RepID=A0A382V5X1_9ZZZZ
MEHWNIGVQHAFQLVGIFGESSNLLNHSGQMYAQQLGPTAFTL